MEPGKWISKRDSLKILEIIQGSLSCNATEDYQRLIDGFKDMLFFDSFISGLVDTRRICYDSLVSDSFSIGYPDGYYEAYLNRNYHLIDPLYRRFYKTFDVQNSRELKALYRAGPERAVSVLRKDFRVSNVFLYGIRDLNMDSFTILSMAGQRIRNDHRTKIIIKYMLPYLSIAMKHIFPLTRKTDIILPTPCELEILKWLKEGKSTWEISVILKKSGRVINFHIDNILKKFNASNRTHAVAIALENHLIPMQ